MQHAGFASLNEETGCRAFVRLFIKASEPLDGLCSRKSGADSRAFSTAPTANRTDVTRGNLAPCRHTLGYSQGPAGGSAGWSRAPFRTASVSLVAAASPSEFTTSRRRPAQPAAWGRPPRPIRRGAPAVSRGLPAAHGQRMTGGPRGSGPSPTRSIPPRRWSTPGSRPGLGSDRRA
jgi:hypothetical protein